MCPPTGTAGYITPPPPSSLSRRLGSVPVAEIPVGLERPKPRFRPAPHIRTRHLCAIKAQERDTPSRGRIRVSTGRSMAVPPSRKEDPGTYHDEDETEQHPCSDDFHDAKTDQRDREDEPCELRVARLLGHVGTVPGSASGNSRLHRGGVTARFWRRPLGTAPDAGLRAGHGGRVAGALRGYAFWGGPPLLGRGYSAGVLAIATACSGAP